MINNKLRKLTMLMLRIPIILGLFLLFSACVTINIYFPAAAAEKAADKIIDKIQGPADSASHDENSNETDSSEPKSIEQEESTEKSEEAFGKGDQENQVNRQSESAVVQLLPPISSLSPNFFPSHLDFFITQAYADANIDISSPAIQAIVDRQAERYKQLEYFYNNGAVGLTNDGLIKIRNIRQVSLKQRKMVKELVSYENQDRLSLYREIAHANNHPKWKYQIRMTFAKRWIQRALPGWWYLNEEGVWQQKELK